MYLIRNYIRKKQGLTPWFDVELHLENGTVIYQRKCTLFNVGDGKINFVSDSKNELIFLELTKVVAMRILR